MKRVLIASTLVAAVAALATRFLRHPSKPEELASLTKDELYQKAKEAEVHGRSEMTKDELIDALAES
jgi:hypothetical protein